MEAEIESRFRRGSAWFRPILDADGNPTALVVHKDSEDHKDYKDRALLSVP
jgi:hypothetical protein